MAICRLIIIGQKIRCVLGDSGVRIGCLQGRLRVDNEQQMLCRLSSQLGLMGLTRMRIWRMC